MHPSSIPPHLLPLLSLFSSHGESAYPVGGCVRDTLLGTAPHDWDVAVTTPPDKTLRLCESAGLRVIPTGIKHGTVTVLLPRSGDLGDRVGCSEPIECTTCRTDGGYTDGRHPDAVTFTGRIADDLSRRDFTVNAMAFLLAPTGDVEILDLFGGERDLADGIIRCVGDPATRFSEDALRMIRAVRFAVRLGFSIHEETAAAIRALAPTLSRISRERVREELAGILCSPAPERGIALLSETGLLPAVLPGGLPAPPAQPATEYGRLCPPLSALPADLSLRLSALLWGQSSDRLAQNLASLKLPTLTRRAVQRMSSPFPLPAEPTPPDARRHRAAFSDMAVPALQVMQVGLSRDASPDAARARAAIETLLSLVQASLDAHDPVTLSELAITGHDLLALGYAEGPHIQAALRRFLAEVIQDPARNTKDGLMEEARRQKP